ncbi:erythrocyte membrane protein 1 (PfEMP1), truncated, putative [Plasmodium sp. gorilla clade G2]|uniref:erythrocyte membrane protein 1 (PfEMP1), truncated, putative n=1 Tax=Plasmodium sp. gorilla clade G2 TaxID=880535 RepID=UPI000D26A266|nr:erythrocyte membrane protein 1 (PfEMP1), truncated, putative [Plasmodium sp. gorilla clade G2]SOV20180.1 erythrocyte membrane protein 1 (PfEMP1), truncated, putative [Plasmodium sp. gorilla clade G2]
METLNTECYVKPCNTLCGGTTCEPCQKECAKYNKWLLTKKNEFNGQKMKFRDDYKQKKDKHAIYAGINQSPHSYLNKNVPTCSTEEFTKLFKKADKIYQPYKGKCKRCIDELTQDVLDKIQNKTGTPNRKKNIFLLCNGKCEDGSDNLYDKYVKDSKYNDIKGQGNCEGLKKEAESKYIKWIHSGGGNEYEYLKNRGVPEDVYIPPRKQKICFQGLDGKITGVNVNDEKTLLEHLIKLAAIEGFNLGEYYKEKKQKPDNEKYKYDVSECSALKYSFLDLRDIILGHDMVETDKEETEQNLKKIFEKVQNEKGSSDLNKERKDFWNQNKDCVWKAMLCGYKKSRDEGTASGKSKPSVDDLQNCGTDPPSETDYPLGNDRDSGKNLQFLRWFAEWGEDFCGHYTRELEKLSTACQKCVGNGNCENCTQCQTQCGIYSSFIKKWKDQYDKQKLKYDDLKDKPPYKNDPAVSGSKEAYEYLDKSLKKSCQNSGTNSDCNCMEQTSSQTTSSSGTHMPKSLDQIPEGYESKCECVDKPAAAKPDTSHQSPGRSAQPGRSQAKVDDQDQGTWVGGPTLNPRGANAGIQVTPASPSPTNPTPGHSPAPASPSSGGGSPGTNGGTGNQAGSGASTSKKTDGLDSLWNAIEKTTAVAKDLGVAAAEKAIQAVNIIKPIAEVAETLGTIGAGYIGLGAATTGIEAAKAGIKAVEKVGPILKTTINTAIRSITNTVKPPAPQPQPGNSGNSGGSSSGGSANAVAPLGPGGQVSPGVGPGPSPPAKPGGNSAPGGVTPDLTKFVTPTVVPWAIGVGFVGIVYLMLK